MQLVIALVLSMLLPSVASAKARIALLVGNQAYNAKVGPLQIPPWPLLWPLGARLAVAIPLALWLALIWD